MFEPSTNVIDGFFIAYGKTKNVVYFQGMNFPNL